MQTKLTISIVAAAAMIFWTTVAAGQSSSPRVRLSFNADWKFHKDDPQGAEGRLSYDKIKSDVTLTGAEFTNHTEENRREPTKDLGSDIVYTQKRFDDREWRRLNLPHDWGIEGSFKQEYPGETGKLPWWGVGWYRKHFNVTPADSGKRFTIEIDGAMAYATVWLNDHFVGGWPYGYASFELNLTPFIEINGENVLVIRLDNPPDSSRWYPGGGIYRNVWLVKTTAVHVAHWGVYVTTPEITSTAAQVRIQTTLDNERSSSVKVAVQAVLYEAGPHGEKIGRPVAISSPDQLEISAQASARRDVLLSIRNPRLWRLSKPDRYLAEITIKQNGRVVDRYETPFGIRTIKFDAEKGFLLNGERVKLQGVCDHHDLGALGSALNLRALERQLEILKEMGVNAIRTSHNPPAPELLDLADRMGLVVMDEAFDAWRRGKKKNDYHLLFDDWHEKDLRAQVRRDRNHPSVVLWSIGNEIGEQGNPEGHALAAELTKIVHEEDLTRPVTAGANNINAAFNGFQKTVDVFGYNYKPAEYGKFRQSNPSIPLFASETASTISSRGEYFFPVVADKAQGRFDFQMSSYDLYAPRWAWPPDVEFKGLDEFPFAAGEFVWTGFDYLGEPTPYDRDSTTPLNFTDPARQEQKTKELKELGRITVPSRSSYFGIVDLAGFKKDRFYIYQARWRPELPMTHILPHWNWPERAGQVTPVHVYTSGDEAELFLNGRSLGRKQRKPNEYRLRWDEVKYEPGELHVVAYKNGKHWAEDTMKTTDAATRLMMKVDRSRITADGSDLSFVTVTITDKNGLPVPRSNNRIRFEISGPGEIVATDNGDPTNFESFQSPARNAFNGLCLVVVRSVSGQAGRISLKAQSPGLRSAVALVTTR